MLNKTTMYAVSGGFFRALGMGMLLAGEITGDVHVQCQQVFVDGGLPQGHEIPK